MGRLTVPAGARVLVVNAGSSSLRLRVIGGGDEPLAAVDEAAVAGEADAREVLAAFLDDAPAPDAAGHRIVHGGADLVAPVLLDAQVEAVLGVASELAPLHDPPALAAVRALRALRPDLPAVACFDTAFHATLPAAASTYALPAAWAERWPLRRFGFHGLAHAWSTRRAAELLGRDPAELRLVTAHLGAGASLAAVAGGRCVDTTMGFTPLEGLVMATRSGSVDPGLLLWVMRRSGIGPEEAERALDRDAGLLGLSGRSADLREVLAAAAAGDERCALAVDVYVHRLVAGVAAMTAALGGLDALVFTGGVGEGSAEIRRRAAAGLGFLGVEIDEARNAGSPRDAGIAATGAATEVLVVHAREDLEIARTTRAVLRR